MGRPEQAIPLLFFLHGGMPRGVSWWNWGYSQQHLVEREETLQLLGLVPGGSALLLLGGVLPILE
jgi:hypothetical protein